MRRRRALKEKHTPPVTSVHAPPAYRIVKRHVIYSWLRRRWQRCRHASSSLLPSTSPSPSSPPALALSAPLAGSDARGRCRRYAVRALPMSSCRQSRRAPYAYGPVRVSFAARGRCYARYAASSAFATPPPLPRRARAPRRRSPRRQMSAPRAPCAAATPCHFHFFFFSIFFLFSFTLLRFSFVFFQLPLRLADDAFFIFFFC